MVWFGGMSPDSISSTSSAAAAAAARRRRRRDAEIAAVRVLSVSGREILAARETVVLAPFSGLVRSVLCSGARSKSVWAKPEGRGGVFWARTLQLACVWVVGGNSSGPNSGLVSETSPIAAVKVRGLGLV